MLDGNTERPDVTERYECATSASRLLLEEHRTGAADVLVAAGWSPTRIGMALLRLHSQWSSSEVRGKREGRKISPTDLMMLANALNSRAAVWEQLAPWLEQQRISADIGAQALLHWLHPVCLHCNGHGLRKVPNAPVLSARQCSKCSGTGNKPHPHGSAKVLAHIDMCVDKARQSMKHRLHNR